jgi:signal transduction histidine kinase
MSEPDPSSPQPVAGLVPCPKALLEFLRKPLAHDLPNQLVAIQGLARVLEMEEGDRLGPDGKDYLRRLAAGAQRAHENVRSLAELVKLGQACEPAGPTPLGDAARAAAAEVSQLFPGRRIEYHFADALPDVPVPRAAVRLALGHLFRNAVQAAAPNHPPRIGLEVRSTPAGQEIQVADNGRGFPNGQRDQWEAFFTGRVPAPPTAGLGLALVRQVVAGWGGRLHVGPAPGGGTVVSLVVPAL